MCVCIYIYTYIHTYIHTCVCVCVCVCVCAGVVWRRVCDIVYTHAPRLAEVGVLFSVECWTGGGEGGHRVKEEEDVIPRL